MTSRFKSNPFGCNSCKTPKVPAGQFELLLGKKIGQWTAVACGGNASYEFVLLECRHGQTARFKFKRKEVRSKIVDRLDRGRSIKSALPITRSERPILSRKENIAWEDPRKNRKIPKLGRVLKKKQATKGCLRGVRKASTKKRQIDKANELAKERYASRFKMAIDEKQTVKGKEIDGVEVVCVDNPTYQDRSCAW